MTADEPILPSDKRWEAARSAGYALVGFAFWCVNQIERHRIPHSKRYNAAHPSPPGQRSGKHGAAWVARGKDQT